MAISTAFAAPCEANSGSVVNLWITDKANIGTVTVSGGEATVIAMLNSEVFYKYEFEQDTAEMTNNASRENSSIVVEHNIEFYLTKMSTLQRNAIQALFDSSTCGMCCIVESGNNDKWFMGWSQNFLTARPLKIASTEGTTGKVFSDGNGTVVNLASSDNELPLVFTGTVPV